MQSGSLSLVLRQRVSIIPFIPDFPLVGNAIAVCFRGKDTEKMRNRLAVRDSRSRGKGKKGRPHRYFAGHVNRNSVACRYINSLFYSHETSITADKTNNKEAV